MSEWNDVWVTILAGGRGSRFWPYSQPNTPKQFLAIPPLMTQSLIQTTYQRIVKKVPAARILVVGLAEHRNHLAEQLPEHPKQNFILEPCGRNTAASIAVAARAITERGSATSLQLVLPADHYIVNPEVFYQAVKSGIAFLKRRPALLTFGIEPRWPETGYGYIELGENLGSEEGLTIHAAAAFREKPDRPTAERYLKGKNHLWNSGMFFWPAQTILDECKQYLPKMFSVVQKLELPSLPEKIYAALESVSIDYGVMEKSKRVVIIRTPLDWSDLGGWESLYRLIKKDAQGNFVHAKKALIDGNQNSLFYCPDMQVIADGIEELVVVCVKGKLLICKRDKVGQIRQRVEELSKS